jgi:hypothetical protein
VSSVWAVFAQPPPINAGSAPYLPILVAFVLFFFAKMIIVGSWTITINFGFWTITIARKLPKTRKRSEEQ